MQKKSQLKDVPNTIHACTHAPFHETGGHLLTFSKALIKGMAEHTEGMEEGGWGRLGGGTREKQQQLRFGKGIVPLS